METYTQYKKKRKKKKKIIPDSQNNPEKQHSQMEVFLPLTLSYTIKYTT
jgi:5'-3' exonuclease